MTPIRRIEIRASEMSKQNSLCFSRLTVCTSVQVQFGINSPPLSPSSTLSSTQFVALWSGLCFRRNMPDHSSRYEVAFTAEHSQPPAPFPLRRDLAIRPDGQEPLTTESYCVPSTQASDWASSMPTWSSLFTINAIVKL